MITPSWDIQRDQPGGLFTFVHVLDSANRVIAQIDTPIDDGFYPNWQAGQQFGRALPIELPRALSTNYYQVTLGVYDPKTGARLTFGQAPELPPEVDGSGALHLMWIKAPTTGAARRTGYAR